MFWLRGISQLRVLHLSTSEYFLISVLVFLACELFSSTLFRFQIFKDFPNIWILSSSLIALWPETIPAMTWILLNSLRLVLGVENGLSGRWLSLLCPCWSCASSPGVQCLENWCIFMLLLVLGEAKSGHIALSWPAIEVDLAEWMGNFVVWNFLHRSAFLGIGVFLRTRKYLFLALPALVWTAAIQICHCGWKAAEDSVEMEGHGHDPA